MSRRFFYKVFLGITWGLLFFTVISIIVLFVDNWPLYPRFTSKGFINFFQIFNSSIKLATGFLSSFIAWLILVRMKQTDNQIESIIDNNKFNNFYSHKIEFKDFFINQTFVKRIKKESPYIIDMYLNSFYETYYYLNYKDFVPKINYDQKELSKRFLEEIEESPLNVESVDLWRIEVQVLKELDELNNPVLKGFIEYDRLINNEELKIYYDVKGTESHERDHYTEKINYILSLYTSMNFVDSLFGFDGMSSYTAHFFREAYITFLGKIDNKVGNS